MRKKVVWVCLTKGSDTKTANGRKSFLCSIYFLQGQFMDLHWQEYIDYEMGCGSEQQNALAWSQMNRKSDDSLKISEALERGLFVVILDGPEYCPLTDALMGCRRYIINSTHNTREEADDILRTLGDMDDVLAYVLPRKTIPPIIKKP